MYVNIILLLYFLSIIYIMPKPRKTIKKTKNNKSKSNRMRKMKGGNCAMQKGGGYGNSDIGHQPYKLNTFNHDPQNTLTNSRNLANFKVGGKSRRRVRKMRGGGISDYNFSPATYSSANTIAGHSNVNSSYQPALGPVVSLYA